MKNRFFCMLTALLVLLSCCLIPAVATETPPTESIAVISDPPATEATQPPTQSTQPPTESTVPSTEATQPPTEATQPSTEATQPPTESTTPTVPAACSHSYGDWNTSEGAHSRSCSKCGHTDSAGHSWYTETVTVAPTCKDAGGKANICTICELILITEITPPLTTHTYTNTCDTACDVCGAQREVTHTYSKAWAKSAKGHWHACTVCGTADEVKNHYAGPAATEEKEQICLTCGYVLMQKRNHTHKLETSWNSDEYGHWYNCTGCSEQMQYANHSFTDGCDEDCDVCGYCRTAPHTYSTDWQKDTKNHWGICAACGEMTPTEAHTPNAAGTACSICGYAMGSTEETHVHTFDDHTWGFDNAGHWQSCLCGEKQKAGPHEWDDGKEVSDSAILYTCKVCGSTRQETMPEDGFPWLSLLAGIVGIGAAVGIIVCVILLRKQGKYSR